VSSSDIDLWLNIPTLCR